MLADDHLVVIEGLVAILATEPDLHVVGQAFDGEQACELYDKLQPDVLIMDLRMPVLNGLQAVKRIVAAYPKAQILMMTTYDTDEDVWRCLREGALGYLLKDARHEQIITAIRNVAQGKAFTTPELAVQLAQRARQPELSKRELATLSMLTKGFSNKQIADKLCMSEGTVKSHLKHIFVKLDVASRTEAIAIALQRGLSE